MGYAYDYGSVSALLYAIIKENSTSKANDWITQRLQVTQETGALQQFNLTFTAIPRFTGKNIIRVTEEELAILEAAIPGFTVYGWTLDALTRAWWLLQLPVTSQQAYEQAIEGLFNAAEMNELVALYNALPLLAWPEMWQLRTAEGIRSNIGIVLSAIMLHNPYPAKYLEEPAWNQLIMKAFFTDKPVQFIIGLDARANVTLANILFDFAHERQAAGRPVNPMQWRLIAPFINADNFPDIERLWHSENNIEKEAAALVCAKSNYPPAQALLQQATVLRDEIAAGKLSWDTIAGRMAAAVPVS
ncbi:EboA domain-containing protein [Chitinophaga defluvii]|uniref:EboA domain-containing protein n=1 Tax=Chitinophaga defluvii TaxID=3163343 RepID=A0ABV2TAB4_9BACT